MIQFQYTDWEDHRVPKSPDPILSIIRKMRLEIRSLQISSARILVHCSNGMGQTGTFIALLELLDSLDAKLSEFQQLERFIPKQADSIIEEANLDIFNCVFNMRKQRCEMVRT